MHGDPARASRVFVGLAIALAVPGITAALEGQVIDKESGKPLANVTLSVIGRTQTARSDAEGRFVLVPDPRPPFELLAILPGGGYVKPVLFEALPVEGPIVVSIGTAVVESVTVTAGAAPGIHAAPASGTTVVSREDVRSRNSRTLTQALENVPGVRNVSEGHAAVPAIRGLSQARTLLLIDGARVTAERRVGPSATFLDPFVVEGVEVARGPGAVAYGSDAFGGVINARTRRPTPGGELSGVATGTLGIGVPEGRLGLEVETPLSDKGSVLLSGHYREFGDYDSPEGEVLDSGAGDAGFLISYAQLVPGGLLSVAVQGDHGRDVERPRTDSDVVRFYYPEESSLRVTAAYETGPVSGFDSTELSLFVGDYEIVTDQDRFATATNPRQIERADVAARDYGLRANAERHWNQTRFDFGLDLKGRFDLEAEDVTIDFDASGMQTQAASFATIEDARRIDTGIYVSAEGAVTPVVALASGLRFDWVRSTNEGGYFGDLAVDNSEPSGYAALTLGAFGGFSTTLQYSHGFRDARLSDRFFRGVTGAGFITGNPDLEAETSDQLDLALRYTARRWRPAIYVYDYHIDDLIERFEDPSQPDFFFFRNRGRAEIRGVELELESELPRGVTLLLAGSVAEGEALDDGTPLDDISPENLLVQARKVLGSRGWVQLRAAWVGELDEPGPNEVALDAYTVVDAAAGWRFDSGLELQLFVRNLLDETYLLTADDRSPLAPGTSAALSMQFTF
ncbi:MAG TPA: TonB-dependent receptor [Candidatus Polarisedimenticolaceae bacterium]|nr:TonB-dependent receptor [Candidatus Polarisedimenticolaceae bacterium]